MIGAVIARLQAPTALFVRVAGLVAYARIENDPPLHQRPHAWVMPLSDSAGPNRYQANAVAQDVQERFAVLCCLGAGAVTGDVVEGDEIEAMRDALVDRLVGWQPQPAHGAVIYAGGQLIRADPRAIYWQFVFSRLGGIRKV